MQCPVCKETTLVMADRQGIEIDYCPKCRGVWLDRGELDKIIERTAPAEHPAAERAPGNTGYDEPRYEHENEKDRGYRRRKRKGFLGDIFDFD